MVMFDLAWLMSKDLSDMLWCVGPSEQLGPRQCQLRPHPALVRGPGSHPDCGSSHPDLWEGDRGASRAQRVPGWGLGRQPFPADHCLAAQQT